MGFGVVGVGLFEYCDFFSDIYVVGVGGVVGGDYWCVGGGEWIGVMGYYFYLV